MSKRPTVIANDRSALWVLSFVLLGCVLLLLWMSWSMQQVGPLLSELIYAPLAGLSFVQAARWRRTHLWRRLATSEGIRAGVPVARPQPVPNAEALSLPFTIAMRPHWFRLLACTVLLGSGIFLLFRFDIFYPQSSWQSALFTTLFFMGFFSWRLFLLQRITIYADGLLVKHPLYDWWRISWGNGLQMGEHLIYWHEARLFAIRSGQPGTPATRYELSSPAKVVTFGRARPTRWWALYRPAIPWENYEAQMDALLDVITARTGLPLYDVRSEPVQGAAQQLVSSPSPE